MSNQQLRLLILRVKFNDYPHEGLWNSAIGVGLKWVGENPLNRSAQHPLNRKDEDIVSTSGETPEGILSNDQYSGIARQYLKYQVTDIKYEYPFYKMSSSKRDADQNSEYDQNIGRIILVTVWWIIYPYAGKG